MTAAAEAIATRPVPVQGDLANLPSALARLKKMPNWVVWRWEWVVNKRGFGKWDKPPLQPRRPQQYARNNDPSTWGSYDEALAAYAAGKCDGLGFNLAGTDIAAFDIDDCRDIGYRRDCGRSHGDCRSCGFLHRSHGFGHRAQGDWIGRRQQSPPQAEDTQ